MLKSHCRELQSTARQCANFRALRVCVLCAGSLAFFKVRKGPQLKIQRACLEAGLGPAKVAEKKGAKEGAMDADEDCCSICFEEKIEVTVLIPSSGLQQALQCMVGYRSRRMRPSYVPSMLKPLLLANFLRTKPRGEGVYVRRPFDRITSMQERNTSTPSRLRRFPQVTFVACGHQICCKKCGDTMVGGPCPTCRTHISQAVKFFWK